MNNCLNSLTPPIPVALCVCATVNRKLGVYREKMLMVWFFDDLIILQFDGPKTRTFHGICNVAFCVDCICHGPIFQYCISCNFFSMTHNEYWSLFISPSSRVNTKSRYTQDNVVKTQLIRSDDLIFEILSVQHDPYQTSVTRMPDAEWGNSVDQMDRCDETNIEVKGVTYNRCFKNSYLSTNKAKDLCAGTITDQMERSDEANIGEKSVTYKRCFKKSYLSTNKAKDKGTVHGTEIDGFNRYLGKLRKRPEPFKGIACKRTSDVAYRITLMLLLTATLSCDAAPVQKNALSFPTLTSDRCDRELLLTRKCQVYGSYMYKMQLKDCAFQCETGYEPRCVPIADGSMFICVPKSFMCPPGVMWSPTSQILNPSTSLMIIEEECPAGFYQPTNSYCFEACSDKHRDTSNMPKELVIYSKGDVKSPTLVFCNHLEGYYNPDRHTLIDYDQEYDHNSYFCSDVSQMKNPCTVDQQILPNGTCVSLCEEGSERDAYSEFSCKKGFLSTRQLTTTTIKPATPTLPETTTYTSIPGKEKTLGDEAVNSKVVAAIIIGVIVFLLIAAVIIILVVRRHRRKLKERKEEESASETASHRSSSGSREASFGVAYTMNNETNAENIINVGNYANVQVHLHCNTSSSSVAMRTINVETRSAINDNSGGPIQTQCKEPPLAGLSIGTVLKIDSVLPTTDDRNSESTDITEATALLFEYPEGDEEPANKSEVVESREPLLTGFQNIDNRNNEEDNTDRKTRPEQSHVESESDITENTKRKRLNSQIERHTGGDRPCDEHRLVSDFSTCRWIDIGSVATDYNEEESTERKKVHSDRTPTKRRNDLHVTDYNKTERKEMVSPSGDSTFGGMCGLEAASHFVALYDDRNNQLPTDIEQTSAYCMENLKEDIGILGNTRLISSAFSDVGLPPIVAERSLEVSVSSRNSSTEKKG